MSERKGVEFTFTNELLYERYIKFQKNIDINLKNVYNVEAKARGFFVNPRLLFYQ